jgi:hypothetical protein
MAPRNAFLRWLFVLTAAVQVLLPSSASFADGWLQRERARAGPPAAHVEAYGSTSCVPIHADDCALCRIAGSPASPGRNLSVPACAPREQAPTAADAFRVVMSVDHGLPASRAPPSLDTVVEIAA